MRFPLGSSARRRRAGRAHRRLWKTAAFRKKRATAFRAALPKYTCQECHLEFKARCFGRPMTVCYDCREKKHPCACGCGEPVRFGKRYVQHHAGKDPIVQRPRSEKMRGWFSRLPKWKQKELKKHLSKTTRAAIADGRVKTSQYWSKTSFKKGWLKTPWGKFRYDSSWELAYLKYLITHQAEIISVLREYPASYVSPKGGEKDFLVDFVVRWKSRETVLVEVKNPGLVKAQPYKIKAAVRLARKKGWKFLLLTSLEACCAGK
jgi:hypothetical protein